MFNQAKLFQLLMPAKFVALDIETGNAPSEAVENAVENWKAPKNWKPETVEAKREEMATKKRDKAALSMPARFCALPVELITTAPFFTRWVKLI
jgi:hypothetical protein